MEWSPERIRTLRLRMGWSQSDLARRLDCEPLHIAHWERGHSTPNSPASQVLELLQHQAELASYEISQSCQVEATLLERDLESIDHDSLESLDSRLFKV